LKNFLFFLLGFLLVAVYTISHATDYVSGNNYACEAQFASYCEGGKVAHFTIQSVSGGGGYASEGTCNANIPANSLSATNYTSNVGPCARRPDLGNYWGYVVTTFGISYIVGVPTPPPCVSPNALNAAGICVLCPSGQFTVGQDYCIPSCDYSRPYEPGNLYQPGTGTCVMPPCGTGQIADSDGRCVPNCPTGEKIDVATGACVADCIFGTTWDATLQTCKNDCPPGQMKDGETGSCITAYECLPGEEIVNGACAPKCLSGELRKTDGSCLAAATNCPFGQHEEDGVCVATAVKCPDGNTWDPVTKTCKSAPVQVTKTETKTTSPTGIVTETITESTTITTGSSPTSAGSTVTGSVTGTTTTDPGTGTTTSNKTYTPASVQKYESPKHELNWDSWNSQVKRAATEGPVRLLTHVQEIVGWFDVEAEAPVFHPVVGGHEFTIDLSMFNGIAEACRFLFACGMTIGVFWFGYRLFGLI